MDQGDSYLESAINLFDESPVACQESDLQGKILRVNRLACELLGYPPEELIGRRVSEFVVSTERETVLQAILERASSTGEFSPLERTFVRSDGKHIVTCVYPLPVRGADGVPTGVWTGLIDFTPRREAEAIQRGVLEAAMDGVAVVDSDGLIVEFNPAAERMFGYSRGSLLGQPMTRLFLPGNFGPIVGHHERVGIRANGEEFPVEVSLSRVDLPHRTLFAGFLRDITARVEARNEVERLIEELDLERVRYETVLRQMPGGVLVVDARGRVMLTNDWMQKLLKQSPPDLESASPGGSEEMKGWSQPNGAPYLAADWPPLRSLRTGEIVESEDMTFRMDGHSLIHLSVRCAPIRDRRGQTIAAGAIFADVTHRRQAEAGLRASERRYRKIFDEDISANIIFTRHLKLLACNGAAVRLFGFETPGEMLAKSAASEFPSAPDRKAIRAMLRSPPSPTHTPVRLHRRDGEKLLAVGTFSQTFDSAGNPIDIHGHLIDVTKRRRAERKVVRLTAQLLNAQTEERRKLSHDLHDSTGQTLSALAMSLGMLKSRWPELPAGAEEFLAECQNLIQVCIRDIRTVSYSLHPPLLEELGLNAALNWYVEGFSKRSSIQVAVEISRDFGRLSREAEMAVFRVVQEALTNIHRHSGSSTARIAAWRKDGRAILEISDQGKGIANTDPSAAGVGLASIRQQLGLVGGALEILTGTGTTLRVSVPDPKGIPLVEM